MRRRPEGGLAVTSAIQFRSTREILRTNNPVSFKGVLSGIFEPAVFQERLYESPVVSNLDCLLGCWTVVSRRGGLENEPINGGEDEEFPYESWHD